MNRLLVIAASGLAREVLTIERVLLRRFTRIRVLDDDPERWGGSLDGEPIEGGLELAAHYRDHAVLVCAGRGSARRSIVARLTELGVTRDRYVGVVHPRVHVPPCCSIGVGSMLLENVTLTTNVTVGDFVVAMPQATLTHDVVVDDYATLCAGVSLAGGVRVGKAAYLGMNASVRERVDIGADSTIGMGAAVLRDVPADETWVGVPAEPLLSSFHTEEAS